MYYKILSDNKIVDAIEAPIYVCYINNNAPVICTRKKAMAIYSNDHSKLWHIEGWGAPPSLKKERFRIVEITQEEFLQLREVLDTEVSIDEKEPPQKVVLDDEKITLETIREYKIGKMREFCANAITKGIDVEIRGAKEHFTLEIED
jgi:hypothetical protein